MDGGFEDQRFAHFSLRHLPLQEEAKSTDNWIQDVGFALKLNNSRLVFSNFEWRKRMEEEIKVGKNKSSSNQKIKVFLKSEEIF